MCQAQEGAKRCDSTEAVVPCLNLLLRIIMVSRFENRERSIMTSSCCRPALLEVYQDSVF